MAPGDNAIVKLLNTVTRLLATYPVAVEEVWRTTVNVARVDTPNRAFNQIPARAEAWLDIRFPAEDADLNGRTVREITEYLQTFCEPDVTVAIDHVDPPHHTDRDRPEVKELRQAAQRQGYPANFLRKHGAGDGAFYSACGIAAVAFGVGGGGQHSPNEYVEIATIVPYYRALREFLERLSSPAAG